MQKWNQLHFAIFVTHASKILNSDKTNKMVNMAVDCASFAYTKISKNATSMTVIHSLFFWFVFMIMIEICTASQVVGIMKTAYFAFLTRFTSSSTIAIASIMFATIFYFVPFMAVFSACCTTS